MLHLLDINLHINLKTLKTQCLILFHTKVSIFANFNIKTLFILILCFLQEENYAVLDIFLFKF